MILQLQHPTNRALLKLSHSHDTHVAHLTPPIHNEWVKSINKLNINISRHRLLRQQQPSPLMTLGERGEWCESSCKGYARMAAAGHVLIKWQPQQRISQLRPADGRSCRRWGRRRRTRTSRLQLQLRFWFRHRTKNSRGQGAELSKEEVDDASLPFPSLCGDLCDRILMFTLNFHLIFMGAKKWRLLLLQPGSLTGFFRGNLCHLSCLARILYTMFVLSKQKNVTWAKKPIDNREKKRWH